MTEARLQFDADEFLDVVEKLEGSVIQGTDAWHQFEYERCLWALTVQDFDGLQNSLDHWSVDDSDRIWSIRKAAVLAEMGAYSLAFELAEQSVIELEELADQTVNVANASRLAWALQWRMAREDTETVGYREEGGGEHPTNLGSVGSTSRVRM